MSSAIHPMIPTLSPSWPDTPSWLYEVKYDGYRMILSWDGAALQLTSRNGHHFAKKFQDLHHRLLSLLADTKITSCTLDGEACILTSPFKADFEALHRGQKENITFMAFDILSLENDILLSSPLAQRKESLHCVMNKLPQNTTLSEVTSYENVDMLWKAIKIHNGEGIVCKKKESKYLEGKRTKSWLKVKNWKVAIVFLLAFDQENGYFHTGVTRSGDIYNIGHFSHGLNSEERTALFEIINRNKVKEQSGLIYVQPGIVLELHYLDLYKGKLRQPRFHRFCFERTWEDCTWSNIQSLWTT